MKKAISILLCLFLVLGLFASDIRVTLSGGRVALLHDNGTWEFEGERLPYEGKWRFTEKSFDMLLDLVLSEMGISSYSSDYNTYKAYFNAALRGEMAGLFDEFWVELTRDEMIASANGEEVSGEYRIKNKTSLYAVDGDDEEYIGYFDDAYTKLYIYEDGLVLTLIKD